MPTRVTVSYRRSDSPYAARGIRTVFAGHFGRENVFMDIDSIPFGVDYREPIDEALSKTDVVIVVIGPKWFGPREGGTPRIFDENDPVRIEVASALKRKTLLVVPLLVDGAEMPGAATLPDDIRDLAYRNASPIDPGRDFDLQLDRVVRSVEDALRRRAESAQAPPEPPPVPVEPPPQPVVPPAPQPMTPPPAQPVAAVTAPRVALPPWLIAAICALLLLAGGTFYLLTHAGGETDGDATPPKSATVI